MKEDVKDKWVAALRSGDYKQGKNYLRVGDSFCCLGVLCEILEIPKAVSAMGVPVTFYGLTPNGMSQSLLPSAVKKLAGMRSCGGKYIGADVVDSLMILNDAGKSFNEIADVIEKHWREL